MPSAYLVPVADHGYHKIDPDTNPVYYSLEDIDGRMIEIGLTQRWPNATAAIHAAIAAGYTVHEVIPEGKV